MKGGLALPPPRGFALDRAWVLGCIASRHDLAHYEAHPGELPCRAVEVWLDLIGPDAPRWLSRCRSLRVLGYRVLLTLRVRREGGAWSGSAAERWAILHDALAKGAADAVDWEIHSAGAGEMAERVREFGGPAAWVASWHRFSGSCDVQRLAEETIRAASVGARWIKLAVMAETPEEWARLKRAWEELPGMLPEGCPLPVLVPMGTEGGRHRVEMAVPGRGALLFGSLGTATAPGQPTAAELYAALDSKVLYKRLAKHLIR